jgi:cellulose synthase/poly-beta-1,6-N-acetylglucosamine synthase-like glycosyltransferase
MTEILVARSTGDVHSVTTVSRVPGQARRVELGTRVLAAGKALFDPETATETEHGDIKRHATIACVVPAYNEEETIGAVLQSILDQTRPPEVVFVVVNNTDDNTLDVTERFIGTHSRVVKGTRYTTRVEVHDIGANPDKKVGALNHGWRLSRGHDYLLGVDGDTTLDRHCLEWLEKEMTDDERIGGLSAIYSIDMGKVDGPFARFLAAGQRAQFAGFNMDNLLRGRNMAVLGGQCSLFNMKALATVCEMYNQHHPWVRDSEVEDSLLSLQIKRAGYSTKISAHARADVGPMLTVKALHAQQVKWNFGAIDLMWPGQRGNTKGQPFHPNLRLRWYENFSMLTNIVTRLAFLLLLLASLSIDAFVFNPVWLIPPAVAMLLNLRLALTMRSKTPTDVLYAALGLPAEVYMWIRMGHFVSAWGQFFAKVEKDNWATQALAEKGKGSTAWLWPLFAVIVFLSVAVWQWQNWETSTQVIFLAFGWPTLYFVTIAQTMFMLRKLLRRYRGFQV